MFVRYASTIFLLVSNYIGFSAFLWTHIKKRFHIKNLIKRNNLLCNVGARYFDKGVFREGDGLDTPLGHPSLPRTPFGFGFKSAQEVSDIVFNINNTDNGNNRRVSHLYMTFGQFMDHDFAYILHPSSSSSGCRARYTLYSLIIKSFKYDLIFPCWIIIRFLKGFASCK